MRYCVICQQLCKYVPGCLAARLYLHLLMGSLTWKSMMYSITPQLHTSALVPAQPHNMASALLLNCAPPLTRSAHTVLCHKTSVQARRPCKQH